ncbi:MAG TPA: ornithine carbamoyltransferase, partial [Nitrososphaerales archaeon]|nr:ornithine carbamoyltransferase [Nitrososphaerales archaeon]
NLARESSVPVINGLSDLYHPVQVLADLLTLKERKGRLPGLKVAWVGDGDNVCNSWALAAAITGIHFVAATPAGYGPSTEVIGEARHLSEKSGGVIDTVHYPEEAVEEADCVMTDTFVSMGFEKEAEERVKAFIPRFRVDAKLMAMAKPDAIFQHCLPAHRGEEVEAEVIDGPQSVVFDEAENRLHTTKALLCYLLTDKSEFASLRP